jgi:hypothetical protein
MSVLPVTIARSTRSPRVLVAVGVILLGSVMCCAGMALPWGRAPGTSVGAGSSNLSAFTIAFACVVVLSCSTTISAVIHIPVTAVSKMLAVVTTAIGSAAWLIFPASIILAVQDSPGRPPVSVASVAFGNGAWLLAAGVVVVTTGSMLLLTKRTATTTISLLVPIVLAALMLVELS